MYRNRRPFAAYLSLLVLAVTCLTALIWPGAPLTGGKAAAQTPTATTTPTPWQTDPLGSPGNYTLFRNDNLFIAGEVANNIDTECDNSRSNIGYKNRSFNATAGSSFNGFDDAADVPEPEKASGTLSNLRVVGGSGRILRADKEQGVIFKLSDFQGQDVGQATYSVELFDKTGNLYQHSLPAVQAAKFAHLDVAAGDLDRLRNVADQYQDEVVLVSESGNKTMQLTVISFLTPANAPWENCAQEGGTCTFDGTQVVRYGADGSYNYGTFNGGVNCSNDVFGDPLVGTVKSCDQTPLVPVVASIDTGIPLWGYFADDPTNAPNNYNRSGQMSVAVGDFNADGKMEIVAVTPAAFGLNISVYRYTNDGQGNAQIVMNDSQNFSTAPSIAAEYADVAAGDFTGAGHDQVVAAYNDQFSPDNEPQVFATAWDMTSDSSGNLKIGAVLSSLQLGSARNNVTRQCVESSLNCNQSITQAGWVQIKAGLFKYDPNNGYTTRRRQVGVVFGNSRPVAGIIDIPPGSTELAWLPSAGPFNMDAMSGEAFWVSKSGGNVAAREYVPDTREAYTIVAGNFGGFNPQNPAWQLAIVAPARTSDTPSEYCDGANPPTHYYSLQIGIAAYQYTQGNGTPESPYSFAIQKLDAPSSASGWTWAPRSQFGRGVAAVALDLNGNSLHLGPPARIVVDNLFTTDAVLQEPPKHLDWVCAPYGQPGAKCDFVNVSRYKEFNLTYTDKDGSDTTNEVSSSADATVGNSNAKTAEESLSVGVPEVASVDLDTEQKFETETDTKTSQENYSKTTTGTQLTYETSTAQADQISARTRTMVVYRYPLYGPPDPNNPGQQKFYDLTLPVETDIISYPGDTSEWYQPIHENGNLLTYPYTGTDSVPGFDPGPDFGFYTVGQEGQCSVSKGLQCRQDSDCPVSETCAGAFPGLLGAPQVNTFGSNPTKTSIEYSQAGTTGANILTSQTLKSSEEFKFSFKATWKLPIEEADVGGSVGGSLQYNKSNENSWSNSTVSESATSSAQGIDFNLPSNSTSYDYQYKTWAYIAQGGFLKVAHAANILGTQVSPWFAQTYGQTYDLSLNLQRKSLPDESNSTEEGKFTLNTDISRKETKSISISDPSVPTIDGAPAYISGGIDVDPAAPEGKTLQLNTRIYNLSTYVPIAGTDPNLVARFELVPYNTGNAQEGSRQTIAEVQIPAIAAYGGACAPLNSDGSVNPLYPVCNSVVVSAQWDTTGLKIGTYRLYVVLDANNALPDEFHEWQDRYNDPLLQVIGDLDPGQPVNDNRTDANGNPFHLEKGQNNEGWMYVQVVAPSADTLSNRTPELSMAQNSLAADTFAAEPDAIRPRANIHTPVRIRARIDSDGDNLGNQHVMFFDQDPDRGGKPFAVRMLRGVTKGANYAWVTYTPRQLGRQTIWARVVEHAADTKPGNHTKSLVLIVRPADKKEPQMTLVVTPLVLWPADGRMVEVRAAITVLDNQDPQPRVRLEAIVSNESNDASADVAGAAFGTDDREFQLRAKRSRPGEEGRIYAITYSAADRSGNKTYRTATVRVPGGRGEDRE